MQHGIMNRIVSRTANSNRPSTRRTCRALADLHQQAVIGADALATDHQAMMSSGGGR